MQKSRRVTAYLSPAAAQTYLDVAARLQISLDGGPGQSQLLNYILVDYARLIGGDRIERSQEAMFSRMEGMIARMTQVLLEGQSPRLPEPVAAPSDDDEEIVYLTPEEAALEIDGVPEGEWLNAKSEIADVLAGLSIPGLDGSNAGGVYPWSGERTVDLFEVGLSTLLYWDPTLQRPRVFESWQEWIRTNWQADEDPAFVLLYALDHRCDAENPPDFGGDIEAFRLYCSEGGRRVVWEPSP